jgi:hypothetical protein
MRKAIILGFVSLLVSLATRAYPAPTVAPTTAPPSSVYGAATISDFLNACKSDHGGCVDEIGNALMSKMTYSGSANVCINSPSYGEPIPGWLTSHPETWKLAPEDGIFTAIQALYPCNNNNPA